MPEPCAYGVTPEVNAKQDAALDAMDAFMRDARKVSEVLVCLFIVLHCQ